MEEKIPENPRFAERLQQDRTAATYLGEWKMGC